MKTAKNRITKIILAMILNLLGILCLCYSDQAGNLLKRPRQWWEWDPRHLASDIDHLGAGWDQIYLGDRSKQTYPGEAQSHYKEAESEFNYELTRVFNPALNSGQPPDLLKLVGASRGLFEVGSRTGRPYLANRAYSDAIKSRPDSPVLPLHFALALRAQGLFPDAITMLKKAIVLAPKNPFLHGLLGVLYSDNKQPLLAQTELKVAKELGLSDSDLALLTSISSVSKP